VPSGPALTGAAIRLKVDDGAVVYVNGVEVARENMPSGPIDRRTLASSNVRTVSETTVAIPASALAEGANTIAVEVHQYRAGSTADLYFDAALDITR